jgi:hypothetical protein
LYDVSGAHVLVSCGNRLPIVLPQPVPHGLVRRGFDLPSTHGAADKKPHWAAHK